MNARAREGRVRTVSGAADGASRKYIYAVSDFEKPMAAMLAVAILRIFRYYQIMAKRKLRHRVAYYRHAAEIHQLLREGYSITDVLRMLHDKLGGMTYGALAYYVRTRQDNPPSEKRKHYVIGQDTRIDRRIESRPVARNKHQVADGNAAGEFKLNADPGILERIRRSKTND